MPLRIPNIAVRVTQKVAESYKKLQPDFINAVTEESDEPKGLFLVPPIGKKKGAYYGAWITNGREGVKDKKEAISVFVLPEERVCNPAELVYLRNLFFNPSDIVVEFIPSDTMVVAKLGGRITLWNITWGIPSAEAIGNLNFK